MDSDLSTQLSTSRAAVGPGNVQTAVLKKAVEAEASVANLVADAVQSAPPPTGQGTRVDKHA
ncbi:MAG: hypothetical protein JWR51_3553 [Devosia sp.]|jgi:hypothetical protein|uniref:hypothetical protein n=1 Tax=Devosia sp. TaxID=1871048 RepID=UPI002606C52F|nr:hypothetical protein [Devosia sp.]MDB5530450.1 hypothetical protein [Devosia sp.]